jgi:hypothetical protein
LKNLPRGATRSTLLYDRDPWHEGHVLPGHLDSRLLDQGLPPGTKVMVRRRSGYDLKPTNNDPSRSFSFSGGIAQVASFYNHQVQGRTVVDGIDFSNLFVVPMERFELRIVLPDSNTFTYFAQISGKRYGDRAHSIDALPERAKSDFAAALKKVRGGTQ